MMQFLRFISQIESRVFKLSVAYCVAQFVSAVVIYITGASIINSRLSTAFIPHIAELFRLGGGQADIRLAASIYAMNLGLLVAYVIASIVIIGPVKFSTAIASHAAIPIGFVVCFWLSFDLIFGIEDLKNPTSRGNKIFTHATIFDYFRYAAFMPYMNAAFMVFISLVAEDASQPWIYKSKFPLQDPDKHRSIGDS